MTRITATIRAGLFSIPLMLTANAYAQLEGTLFTDPDEREYLDYLREEYRRNNAAEGFNIEEVDIPEIPEEVAAVAEDTGPREFSFGGVMTRSNGSHRIWLNGTLLAEAQLPDGFSLVENDRLVSLRIVQDGRTFLLRPGQTLNVADGTVSELARAPAPTSEDAGRSPINPTAETSNATRLATEATGIATVDEGLAIEPETAPERAEEMDRAVEELSEEEAMELAAALERRRAASTEAQSEPVDTSDEP